VNDLAGSSVSGPRPYNEDNYLLTDLSEHRKRLGGLTAFVMVSDGMGGHSSGDVASRVAVETATSYLKDLLELAEKSDVDVDVAQALREISEEAHEAIVAEAAKRGAASMGATFVAAFVSRDHAWVGHVGDSRAYLLSAGSARQLTVDHSQVGRLIAEGVLTEEQAQHHPSRNVIERALGFSGATADVVDVDLRPGDAILLCSDGVSTALSGADMLAIAASKADPDLAAAALTSEAIRAGGDDNATAVLWVSDWEAFRKASGASHRPRRGSTGRRTLSRHYRAQRASLWAVGVMAVLAMLFVAGTVLTSGGAKTGGSAVAVATTATPMPATSTPEPAVAQRVAIGKGVNLRTKASTNSTTVASTDASIVVVVAKTSSDGKWFGIDGLQLAKLTKHLVWRGSFDAAHKPGLAWVRADKTVPHD
jgi:PPM family protein phosphatase